MIRDWLGKLAAALALAALPATVSAAPDVCSRPADERVTTHETCLISCWHVYGRYYCYQAACAACSYLRSCGYDARIVDKGYCYEVQYRS